MQLTIANNTESLQEALAGFARSGRRVALVPTMGALHAGHMSLIALAKQHADAVVTTIFVNPKQFAPHEDFARYPRMIESDIQKIDEAGGDLVYTPPIEDVYSPGFSTVISVGGLAGTLEGKSRPGFFDGVATVLTKMFLRVLPHVVILGEKDYQQVCVVRKLVLDLDLPMEVIGAPTVREADGLAMSSRNAYLSQEERRVAPKLHEILNSVGNAISSGSAVQPVLAQGISALGKAGFKVDYLELCDAETLAPAEDIKEPARLLAAAWLGNTRLIDNIAIGRE